MLTRLSRAWVALAVSFALASCSAAATDGAASSPAPDSVAPTSSADPSSAAPVDVLVTKDVTFADAAPREDWTEPLLDVYAPAGATDLPLVVIYPAHGLDKAAWPVYVDLATAIAASGAVVAVASWSETDNGPESTTDPALAISIIDMGRAVAACAVSYMVENAPDFGADPSRLALFGHFYGANTAVMVALEHPAPMAGCHASSGAWSATAAGGWDGDWMAFYPAWDAYEADASQVVDALTPWSQLDTASPMGLLLAVTAYSNRSAARCDDPDSATTPWLGWRDPHNVMRASLDAIGAFDDGCLDPLESTQGMVDAMAAHGFEATSVYLEQSTSSPQGMPDGDIALLVTELQTLLEGSPAP